MSNLRRVATWPAALVVGLVLLSACAQVPHAGPVVEAKERGGFQAEGEYYNPKGPQPGESTVDIVTGFLNAMTAIPLRPTTAQEFLSKEASAQWQPQRVVIYDDHALVAGTRQVVVRLRGAEEVGLRAQWLGPLSQTDRRLVFPMVREKGEWRIAQVPDALIIPRSFYDQEYQPANIYFFDPTGQILVPELVHVPEGSQLASSLVRALVSGPSRSSTGVVRTFLPPGLSPFLSVPVANDGVAEVTLKGPDPGPLSRRTTRLILAQLSWTLRQDPSITGFRLSIAGRQIVDASGARSFKLGSETNDPHDPAVSLASGQFYAIRKGLLVSGQLGRPSSVDGPFGRKQLGVGPFAVRLDGSEVAAVTPTALLLGPVAGPAPAVPILYGSNLLRPAWDFDGRLWEVQNTAQGAGVVYFRNGHRHQVRVPGVSGRDVRRFLVSRDGSRFVAVVHGRKADRIVVSRLRYDADTRGVHGTWARRIPWATNGATRVRDIGWTSPTTLEVLDQISQNQAEARILDVDGSVSADETPSVAIPGHAIGLATSPVDSQTPYALLRHSVYDLAQDDATRTLSPPTIDTPGLLHITYAG